MSYEEPKLKVSEYCAAFRAWAELATTKRWNGLQHVQIISDEERRHIELAITKSCLLKRMLYMGELTPRKRKCPIHNGHWSGMYIDRCPAGCDTCGCCSGWIPDDAKIDEAWGWTFWLAHAIDPESRLPGVPLASWYKKSESMV